MDPNKQPGPKLQFADFSSPQSANPPPLKQTQQIKPEPQQPQKLVTPAFDPKSDPMISEPSSTMGGETEYVMSQRTPSKFYVPGQTQGQPHRESHYRYCYNITKKQGKEVNQFGDKFDYFLYQADKKINYYESRIINTNPYNPFKMEVEFKINNVDDQQYEDMKKVMKQKYGMKVDELLAIEGCINDDKTILGGKNEFLAHFCTFFNFNICFSAKEGKALKKTFETMSNVDTFDKKIDDFMKKFDEME